MKFLEMLKCCLNYKVIIGVGIAIALAYFFVPQLAQYSWVLIALVCPLSMILMMAMMDRKKPAAEKLFVCPECGFSYRDAEWAKKCAAWCKEHKSCNLEITKHAAT
ncbi:hypothetical protein A3H74_04225 [Candidatus Kaiserbacteria bacterium RIFCSPLOWO2_02_FULL_51_13]|uniref:Uncharacterized protein n=1 Tax=Candidatus Kaiserbacteria bacterium RIFCSPLOWO2_01_FULL_50_24 TaxID=1798507 RepID=A0A1F6EN10_9BACT|nr:MAG: hypothetical protein A3A34_02655 [Candidatus Kaiserbacteria bacterium RIFCSPLOWO2_01_FULL_50_24]OGG82051.1 MAG: hypothetical protein A3H74_04225 [Candidatus Kaiserbacteria bacterium RIFCSPLOWO2_02_FULL_51_13]